MIVSNLTSVVASIVAMLALDWRLTVVSLLLLPRLGRSAGESARNASGSPPSARGKWRGCRQW